MPVRFYKGAKKEMVPGSDGVLGADALRKVSLSFDPLYQTVEVVPGTKLGLAMAQAYFAKLPAWGGPSRVVKVPLSRTVSGCPIIKSVVGGKARPFSLTFSIYNSTLGSATAPKAGRREEGWNYFPKFSIAGLAPRWLSYGYYADWGVSDYGSYGLIALDHFLSRRVLVDLAGDAVYVEELSEPARVSMLLTSIVKLPIVVTGEKAAIEPIPGYFPEDGIDDELADARVTKIAGIAIGDLIRDVRAGTSAANLAKLSEAMHKDYDITVIQPDGTERDITIPHDEAPSETYAWPSARRVASSWRTSSR
ncbi:hypothetical protein EON82_03480 [bacterium]|nr:MAG: hypothetical protein EON82_03480 [bacterium]